jgi:hypothetical protein
MKFLKTSKRFHKLQKKKITLSSLQADFKAFSSFLCLSPNNQKIFSSVQLGWTLSNANLKNIPLWWYFSPPWIPPPPGWMVFFPSGRFFSEMMILEEVRENREVGQVEMMRARGAWRGEGREEGRRVNHRPSVSFSNVQEILTKFAQLVKFGSTVRGLQ